jgi:hypothetical protein
MHNRLLRTVYAHQREDGLIGFAPVTDEPDGS